MHNEPIYEVLRKQISRKIYEGEYTDGNPIPPERILSQEYNVSRVTVRKAIDSLRQDHIIESRQGIGNVVNLQQRGYPGDMSLITLVAPSRHRFFSDFLNHFQQIADRNNSLVLYLQNKKETPIEDLLFQLLERDIHNVVLWVNDFNIDPHNMAILRALGLNIVFFDAAFSLPCADAVFTDNQDAIATLYDHVCGKAKRDVGYVGWDNKELRSSRDRESTFLSLVPNADKIWHMPWYRPDLLQEKAASLAQHHRDGLFPCESIICGDGEIGIAVSTAFRGAGCSGIEIVSMDNYQELAHNKISVYEQRYDELALMVYECLQHQNNPYRHWKARGFPIKGNLIVH